MTLQDIIPARDKLFDLQREGKISINSFTYGLTHSSAYVKIEIEVNKTRERVIRTMTGKNMEEAVSNTVALLNQIK